MLRKVLSRFNLLMRFTLVSFFLMTAIAIILIIGIQQRLENNALRQEAHDAESGSLHSRSESVGERSGRSSFSEPLFGHRQFDPQPDPAWVHRPCKDLSGRWHHPLCR